MLRQSPINAKANIGESHATRSWQQKGTEQAACIALVIALFFFCLHAAVTVRVHVSNLLRQCRSCQFMSAVVNLYPYG